MATKAKTTKRSKKLTTGKKMAGVKPLLKYELPNVLITSVPTSDHGGGGFPSES